MTDSGNIYIKERVTSGKIPTHVLVRSSAVGSASHHRTWGTRSRQNLMKTRLICRSVRSMLWAVKKASAQLKVMYDKRRVMVVTSKSSSLPEEPERRISRGYYRSDRPRNIYLCGYWAKGPV